MKIGMLLFLLADPPQNSFLVSSVSVFEKWNEFGWHRVTIPYVPLMLQHEGDSVQSAGSCKPSFFSFMTAKVHVSIT